MTTQPLADRSDSVRVVLAVAAVVQLGVAFAVLAAVRWDVSVLVHAAPPWTDPTQAPRSLTVLPAGNGFDGQFYYRLAVSPFSGAPTVAGVTFDVPGLRATRIGYPLLAFVTSAGVTAAVPWAMFVVNLMAGVAVAGCAAGLAHAGGLHRMWGLAALLWPGYAYTVTHDLAELGASALVLGALLACRRRRVGWAAASLAGAVLVRETTLLVAAGLIAGWICAWWRARRAGESAPERSGLVAGLTAATVFAVVQLAGWLRLGRLPIGETVDANTRGSEVGIWAAISRALPPRDLNEWLTLAALLLLGLLLVVGVCGLWRSSAPIGERFAWILAAALMFSLNGYPWLEPKSFLRATTELWLLTLVLAFGLRSSWPRGLLAGWSALVAAGAFALMVGDQLPTLAALVHG